jgi:CRP-like cAMP-binding protein
MTETAVAAAISAGELRRIGLFGAISDEVLSHLASTLSVVEPPAGEVIVREGEDAREMYVVVSGEVEILKRSKRGVDSRVALLGPGDWFGEMSIVDVQPRSATVRTLAPARLLKVTAADLDALYRHDLKAYALIVLNVARELSRRLRVADSILADLIANVLDSYLVKPSAR